MKAFGSVVSGITVLLNMTDRLETIEKAHMNSSSLSEGFSYPSTKSDVLYGDSL